MPKITHSETTSSLLVEFKALPRIPLTYCPRDCPMISKKEAQIFPFRQDSESRSPGDSYSGDLPCQMMENLKWQSRRSLSQPCARRRTMPFCISRYCLSIKVWQCLYRNNYSILLSWPLFIGHTCPFGSGSASSGGTLCLLSSYNLTLAQCLVFKSHLPLPLEQVPSQDPHSPVLWFVYIWGHLSLLDLVWGNNHAFHSFVHPWLHGHKGKADHPYPPARSTWMTGENSSIAKGRKIGVGKRDFV